VLPFVLPLVWFLLLPLSASNLDPSVDPAGTFQTSISREDYVAVPTDEVDDGNPISPALNPETPMPAKTSLSLQDKWHIVKPLLGKYMLPLCECGSSRLFLSSGSSWTQLACIWSVRDFSAANRSD
jgi:battenin